MSTVGGISLSGMNAAMRQLDASAENIANARSSGPMPDAANASGHPAVFTPLDVEQTPNANGGVSVRIAASSAAGIPSGEAGNAQLLSGDWRVTLAPIARSGIVASNTPAARAKPIVEAVAFQGVGVFETLKEIAKQVLTELKAGG